MTIVFMFLDGVGLGLDDIETNPFSRAEMPYIQSLLKGGRFTASSASFENERASLFSIDPTLNVPGLPQSATGQASLLTGRNIPAEIGYHYGPKPDKATAFHLQGGGIFGELLRRGRSAALINAYPSDYFHGINSGRRIYSAIPMAVTNVGLKLFTTADLLAGSAVSADFTGIGWHEKLNVPSVPIFSPIAAGRNFIRVAQKYDFTFFEYWLTDHAGHRQNMENAVNLLEQFDQVLSGIGENMSPEDLILLTSDHGNLEDLSTRHHTLNPVPLFLLGNRNLRLYFKGIGDLTGVAPAILSAINGH